MPVSMAHTLVRRQKYIYSTTEQRGRAAYLSGSEPSNGRSEAEMLYSGFFWSDTHPASPGGKGRR